MARIESAERLREVYKAPSERAVTKQLSRLDRHCRRFIELSPFVLLATSGAGGSKGDVSPKGDAPGFVQVLDDATLAIPDRPGNNRLDTLSNLIANPEIGLLFMIPGFEETLRVNGAAVIEDDEVLRARFAVNGRLPASVIVVSVRECYLHCAKSVIRARLWQPTSQVEREVMPTMGAMVKEQTGLGHAETRAEMLARYADTLY
jgi:uncharacterized protein